MIAVCNDHRVICFYAYIGNGQPWSSRAFSTSTKPKVLTDEMEYVREIFSSRSFVVLYNIFDIRHTVLVPVDGLQQQL